MATEINYPGIANGEKADLNPIPSVDNKNKITADDMNHIRAVVNANAGELNTLNGAAVKTSGDQSISGEKTFNDVSNFEDSVYINSDITVSNGSAEIAINTDIEIAEGDYYAYLKKDRVELEDASKLTKYEIDKINYNDGSQTNEISLPSKTGTIAIDEEVVHNTGNESVSGEKIFQDKLTTAGDVHIGVNDTVVKIQPDESEKILIEDDDLALRLKIRSNEIAVTEEGGFETRLTFPANNFQEQQIVIPMGTGGVMALRKDFDTLVYGSDAFAHSQRMKYQYNVGTERLNQLDDFLDETSTVPFAWAPFSSGLGRIGKPGGYIGEDGDFDFRYTPTMGGVQTYIDKRGLVKVAEEGTIPI